MEKIAYIIDVEKDVARNRRDVYMIISNNEQRRIFFIKRFQVDFCNFRMLLRHTKNRELGSLIDVIGFKRFNQVRSAIYKQIVSHDIFQGKYIFEFERGLQDLYCTNLSSLEGLLEGLFHSFF